MKYWITGLILCVLVLVPSVLYSYTKAQSVQHAAGFDDGKNTSSPTPQLELDHPPLVLDQFFDGDTSIVNQYPHGSVRTMIATGDIIPGRSVNYKSLTYNNFNWAYEPTADYLRDADITFVNLESPVIENCPVTNEGMIFCGDVRNVDGLAFAGVDMVNLGNNHAGNQGAQGIAQTLKYLGKKGIMAVGVENNPQYLDVRGMTFAFLGYDDVEQQNGVSRADPDTIRREIQIARENADYVIVQLHWGVEYVSQPSDRQRDLGKIAIDAGADLIIGNHPHWIQPVEIYKNKLITYAHGNFIFDQMWSEKTREGVVGKYYFYNDQLIDAEYIPIKIFDYGQAQFITDEAYKNKILQEMREESEKLVQASN